MKTDIYTLLGMIKDDNIPQRILFRNQVYEYVKSAEDYYNEEHGYIFDVYVLKSILNDEVTILETTITFKPDKIEKLEKVEDFKLAKLIDKINEIIDKLNGE